MNYSTVFDQLVANIIIDYSCLSDYHNLNRVSHAFYEVIRAKDISYDPNVLRYVSNKILLADKMGITVAYNFIETYKKLLTVIPSVYVKVSNDPLVWSIAKSLEEPDREDVHNDHINYAGNIFIDYELYSPNKVFSAKNVEYALRNEDGSLFKLCNGLVCFSSDGFQVMDTDCIADHGDHLDLSTYGYTIRIKVASPKKIVVCPNGFFMRNFLDAYGCVTTKLHVLVNDDILAVTYYDNILKIYKIYATDSFVSTLRTNSDLSLRKFGL